MSDDPAAIDAALAGGAAAEKPLIHAATAANWQAMAEVAKKHGCPLVIRAEDGDLDGLAELSEQVRGAGVEDLVLDPGTTPPGRRPRRVHAAAPAGAQEERAAARLSPHRLRRRRRRGRPSWCAPPRRSPSTPASSCSTTSSPAMLYPLLTLRQNIYTDPQKPIQVEPKLYEIGAPDADSPLLITTNFSLTYFSVAGEVEGAGIPAWLLVADSDGQSVLTGWAAGKFDAEKIAKTVKDSGIARQGRATRSWSSPATWPGSRARSRRSCPAGRSWSARATPSTSPATSRTSGARDRDTERGPRSDQPRTAMATITFTPSGETIEVPSGTSLLDAAILCELDVPAPCAGQGRCGRCRVRVVERRGRAAQQRRPRRPPRSSTGWAVACQTYVGGSPRGRGARARARRRCGRTATPSPSRSRCPSPATSGRTRRCALFELDIEPPSLERQHQRLRPPAPGALRSSTASRSSAPSCPCSSGSARPCARPTGRSPWPSRCATGCTGPTCPPRLLRVYPTAFHAGQHGPRRRPRHDLGGRLPRRLHDRPRRRLGERLQQADRLRRRRHQPHHLRQAQGRASTGCSSSPSRPSTTCSSELQQRNGIELQRDPRGRRRRQHDDDPPAARPGPAATCARSRTSRPSRRRPSSSPASWACNANPLARVHCPAVAWAATWAATSPPASSRRACTPPRSSRCSSTSAPTARWSWATRTGCSRAPAPPAPPSRAAACGTACAPPPGAIEDVFIDDATWEPTFRTIDDAPAVGICGSGLIDLLGELFVTGLLDKSGHARPRGADRARPRARRRARVRRLPGRRERRRARTSSSPSRTSPACCAPRRRSTPAIEVLCASVGVDLADVEQILIGGAFGQYLNVEKAIRIGLLPDQPVERFHFLGNTSALRRATPRCSASSVRHDVIDVAAQDDLPGAERRQHASWTSTPRRSSCRTPTSRGSQRARRALHAPTARAARDTRNGG